MWLKISLAGSAVVVIVAVLTRILRRRSKEIDMGSVSEGWLAEQRKHSEHTFY